METKKLSEEFNHHLKEKNFKELDNLNKAGFKPSLENLNSIDKASHLNIDEKVATKAIFGIEPPKNSINENLKRSDNGMAKIQEHNNELVFDKDEKKPDSNFRKNLGHLIDKSMGDM